VLVIVQLSVMAPRNTYAKFNKLPLSAGANFFAYRPRLEVEKFAGSVLMHVLFRKRIKNKRRELAVKW
jgi:hypothetical protein